VVYVSKKLKETLKVDNHVVVEVIDKKTGEVVKRVESKNTTGQTGADHLIKYIRGYFTTLPDPWRIVYLFKPDRSKIKELVGTWGTEEDTGTVIQNTITALDTSNDTYTVDWLGLQNTSGLTLLSSMLLWQDIAQTTKGADQNFRVRWTVRCSYTQP
jgi:hypothetical protein